MCVKRATKILRWFSVQGVVGVMNGGQTFYCSFSIIFSSIRRNVTSVQILQYICDIIVLIIGGNKNVDIILQFSKLKFNDGKF